MSKKGIKMDPKKIEEVWDWVRPTSVTKIKCFLGFGDYYSHREVLLHFIPINYIDPEWGDFSVMWWMWG